MNPIWGSKETFLAPGHKEFPAAARADQPAAVGFISEIVRLGA